MARSGAGSSLHPLAPPSRRQSRAALASNVEALIHLLRASQGPLEQPEERAKVIALSSHGSPFAVPMYAWWA